MFVIWNAAFFVDVASTDWTGKLGSSSPATAAVL